MKRFRLNITEKAAEDLLQIFETIGERDIRAAEKLLRRLEVRIQSLDILANRGALRSELGDGVRILIDHPYLIVYREIADDVQVLRIVHGAMDLQDLFN